MAFKVGDIVRWGSQAAGSYTEKAGSIVAVIPAGVDPRNIVMEAVATHKAKNAWGRGASRKDESYVVLVPHRGPSGKGLPSIYVPVASQLKPA